MSDAISVEEVERVARLARLALTEEQTRSQQQQLCGILDHMKELASLDVSGVEPFHERATGMTLADDVPAKGLSIQEALRSAPSSEQRAFVVPKVLEGS